MIRPKGGRSQPRYFHYKEAAEKKMIDMLRKKKSSHGQSRKRKRGKREEIDIDLLCLRLKQNSLLVDQLIANMKKTLAEIRAMTGRK